MKQLKKLTAAAMLAATFALSFTSCKKEEEDEGKLPLISFKTGGSYISKDTMVAKNTAYMSGVIATKAEPNDPLTKFTISRSFNSGTDSVVYTENLSGTLGDAYSKDYTITTGNVAGTEKYTYTVVNKDGLINKASLTLTVQ